MSDESELAFLGEEFLTWLWFRLEADGGEFTIDERHIGVAIDDLLAFAPRDGDETEQTLRKGFPIRAPEARSALRTGHRLRRAKLIVADGEQQWTAIVDGPTLSLSSIKLPEDLEAEATTPRDRSTERISSFLELHDLVRGVYRVFLDDRLREDYAPTSGQAQAQWMATA
ncbi:MAG: hypothetical protein AAF628_07470 [Planctomycetota bacterium]